MYIVYLRKLKLKKQKQRAKKPPSSERDTRNMADEAIFSLYLSIFSFSLFLSLSENAKHEKE